MARSGATAEAISWVHRYLREHPFRDRGVYHPRDCWCWENPDGVPDEVMARNEESV